MEDSLSSNIRRAIIEIYIETGKPVSALQIARRMVEISLLKEMDISVQKVSEYFNSLKLPDGCKEKWIKSSGLSLILGYVPTKKTLRLMLKKQMP